jgi:hypothetical protein
MSEFFKPWRRRIGIVMLVFALVFLGGWVRSQSTVDVISFRSGTYLHHWLASDARFICWTRQYEKYSDSVWEVPEYSNSKRDASHDFRRDPNIKWYGALREFGVFEYPASQFQGNSMATWLIPYWYVILPLALLSTYLLFVKPRKSTSKKPADPIPADGKNLQS